MPSAPATNTILTAIQTLATAQLSPTYIPAANIIVGMYPDPTAFAPCLEIYADDDQTQYLTVGGRVVQGAKVNDSQVFILFVTLPANDRQAAEVTLANLRDALTSGLHASATLNTPGVQLSHILPRGKRGYIERAGQAWRLYKLSLHVQYDYSVTVVP